MMSGRSKSLLVMVSISLLSIVAGLIGGFFIKSPAQRAAENAPPPVTILTEPVERSVIEKTITTSASLEHSHKVAVVAEPGQVVTKLPLSTGAVVSVGSVVAEISARPVLAFQGILPQYRELQPGASGEDVNQLIVTLGALGHTIDEKEFGPATQAALTEVYRAVGYEPQRVGDAEARAALDAKEQATRSRRDAKHAVSQAEANLARARRPAKQEDDPQARRDAIADAERALDMAKEAAGDAEMQLDRATEAATAAVAAAGVKIPLGELAFLPKFPASIEVTTGLGPSTGGEVVTLTSGELVGYAALQPADGVRVVAGQQARILLDGAGPVQATVTDIETKNRADPRTNEIGTVYVVTLTPKELIEPGTKGTDLRAIITIEASNEGLHVPIMALTTTAQGDSQVVVRGGDGTLRTVIVSTGFEGDGRVQVTAKEADSLAEGDEVVIGA